MKIPKWRDAIAQMAKKTEAEQMEMAFQSVKS